MKLGFYYEFDEGNCQWLLIGSKSGLQNLSRIVDEYASNPRNDLVSEHEHLGPYMYLELMTWTEPRITAHAIEGRLVDLKQLSLLIDDALSKAQPGDQITIDSQYSSSNEATLKLQVRADDFDPAIEDKVLW